MKYVMIFTILLLGGVGGCYFVHVEKTEEIKIAANFDNCVEQVMHPVNWKNWYPGINRGQVTDSFADIKTRFAGEKNFTVAAGPKKYAVKMITPVSYIVEEAGGKNPDIFSFTILPCIYPDSVNVTVKRRMRLMHQLFPFFEDKIAVASALSLKSYLEDSLAFYGFPIQFQDVTDTVYITKEYKTAPVNLYESLQEEFYFIEDLIAKNNLKVLGNRNVSYTTLPNDSVAVLIGIAVNGPVPPDDHARRMAMPRGRMLTGLYEGRFDKRNGIYDALRKYIADRHLAQVSAEYEQYIDNCIPVADSSIVRLRVFFPVL